jgi:hypothetical protein
MSESGEIRMELSAANMERLAQRLDVAVSIFDAWGIRVVDSSRLRESSRLLRRVYAAGAFPTNRDELLRVSHAVRDATEFVEIGDALPQERLHPLASDLERAVGGALGRGATQAVQYQTQLWVGAMLTYSGANVGVLLNADRKRPDFVIANGTLNYATEVKRPNEFRADRIISRANKQISNSRYHGGVIVVDLTDCIDQKLAITVGPDPHQDDTEAKREATRLTAELSDEIYDNRSRRLYPNRTQIFGLVTTGRTIHWDENDTSRIYLMRFLISVTYWRGYRNTLRGSRAQWLTKLVQHGVSSAGSIEIRTTKLDL